MTQEDKELLLRDLCARLPYGVKVHLSRKHNRPEEDIVLNNIIIGKDGFVTSNIIGYNYLLSEIKPYLRPMSSMTEEEINEFILISDTVLWLGNKRSTCILSLEQMDWLNKNMFDYRGLIEKGLALDTPKGMYNES